MGGLDGLTGRAGRTPALAALALPSLAFGGLERSHVVSDAGYAGGDRSTTLETLELLVLLFLTGPDRGHVADLFDYLGVRKCRDVAEGAPLRHVAEQPPHDLSRPGLG
jgi:hypothetical protein